MGRPLPRGNSLAAPCGFEIFCLEMCQSKGLHIWLPVKIVPKSFSGGSSRVYNFVCGRITKQLIDFQGMQLASASDSQ